VLTVLTVPSVPMGSSGSAANENSCWRLQIKRKQLLFL